jgi:hypothetical protein
MPNYKVTCHLSSPLAGDAPYLDAMMEFILSQHHGKAKRIQRWEKLDPVGTIHLPLLRGKFGGVDLIPRCSAPILETHQSTKEHFAKRISVENARLLRENERKVVAVGNTWTKSYRLPLEVHPVHRVAWFVGGSKRRNLKTILDDIDSIGKKRSHGYGRVARWAIDEVEHDWSWFADTPHGKLLMRVLPWCESLRQCIGWKRAFAGWAPPYWHPERYIEVAVPC